MHKASLKDVWKWCPPTPGEMLPKPPGVHTLLPRGYHPGANKCIKMYEIHENHVKTYTNILKFVYHVSKYTKYYKIFENSKQTKA